jgi:hypothetical protein
VDRAGERVCVCGLFLCPTLEGYTYRESPSRCVGVVEADLCEKESHNQSILESAQNVDNV